MAVITGVGGDVNSILGEILAAATSKGWVQSPNASEDINPLYLSRGVAKVALTTRLYPLNSDLVIIGSLVKDFLVSDSYWTFPGATPNVAPSNGSTGKSDFMVGDLSGSFQRWWIFTSDGDESDYVYAVILTGDGRYNHLGFGLADASGMTHSGVAFMTSSNYANARGITNPGWIDTANWLSYGRGPEIDSISDYTQMSAGVCLYSEDALPATFTNQVAFNIHRKSNSTSDVLSPPNASRMAATIGAANYDSGYWPGFFTEATNVRSALLAALPWSGVAGWSNAVPLSLIPFFAINPECTQICFLGIAPNYRLCSLEGLSPEQELDYAGDTWIVFPPIRQAPWTDGDSEPFPNSGQYGMAYKV